MGTEMENTAVFTPEEVGTIRMLKDDIIRDPEVAALLQDIISIFAAIRSKVASIEIGNTQSKISIAVDPTNQLIRLHEETEQTLSILGKVFARITRTSQTRTKTMIISRRGFTHKINSEKPTKGNPSTERKQCYLLLKHFHDKLQASAKAILDSPR